ncbi:MAG: hypothetical protein RBT49_18900, partial [Bacteroidales bacterium]|nr:hypothetical protein [Bacteroidales bacterium]
MMVRTNLLKYTVFIIVCLGFLNKTFSQKTTAPADSLEKLLIAEQVDSNKIKLQLQLFAFYYMNDAAKENHYL